MIRAIVGANWGDEGKGKMTDFFAAEADFVVRYQGGSNAGHTIINEHGKFALHLLPSGAFSPTTVNIIANGVALNVAELQQELASLQGYPIQLKISDRAQVMLPHHLLLDRYEEERLAKNKYGSTQSGIAPFYADKFAKVGLQVWQLYDDPNLAERVANICLKVNVLMEHLYRKPVIHPVELLRTLKSYSEWLRPYITDTSTLLRQAIADGKTILLEGQLGALRDPDHGIYPYTTSSSTLAGYATVGAGLPAQAIDTVTAVVKAYSSCVGEGPFTVELHDAEAEELRKRGGDAGEYGAKTGRPRRVGYFDAVASRYGCALQGASEIALTGLDVLGYLKEIPVCIAYEIDGGRVENFPNTALAGKAKPIYTNLPGWQCDIRGERDFANLPAEAIAYARFIQQELGVPIHYLSTGPERESLINVQGLL